MRPIVLSAYTQTSCLGAGLHCAVILAPGSDSVTALSYVVFGGCVGLFATLLGAFVWSAVRPPVATT